MRPLKLSRKESSFVGALQVDMLHCCLALIEAIEEADIPWLGSVLCMAPRLKLR